MVNRKHFVDESQARLSQAARDQELLCPSLELHVPVCTRQGETGPCLVKVALPKMPVTNQLPSTRANAVGLLSIAGMLMERCLELMPGHPVSRTFQVSAQDVVRILVGNAMPAQFDQVFVTKVLGPSPDPPQDGKAVFEPDSKMLTR